MASAQILDIKPDAAVLAAMNHVLAAEAEGYGRFASSRQDRRRS